MDLKHIFMVGAGTMGNGIAQVAATSGYQVTCMDVMPAALEKAKAVIDKSTAKLVEKGVLTKEQKSCADAIQFVSNMDMMNSADFVIEAATVNPEIKFKLFEEMDAAARPDVIFASNTSSVSITKIAAQTKRPDKVIGMHFMNPVPLMKLVEVIKGLATSEETLQTTLELCKVMGKEPVEANDFAGLYLQPHLMSDDQRSDFCFAEKCRYAGSDRHSDEARHELSDGPAGACRFDRIGCNLIRNGSFTT